MKATESTFPGISAQFLFAPSRIRDAEGSCVGLKVGEDTAWLTPDQALLLAASLSENLQMNLPEGASWEVPGFSTPLSTLEVEDLVMLLDRVQAIVRALAPK